jgi:streptogramin lyase
MKVTATFIGGLECGDARSVSFRGVEFPLGKPVNLSIVTPDGRTMLAKLKGNRFFEVQVVAEDIEVVEPKPAAKSKAKPKVEADGPAGA